jgi:hypothetical protein
MTSVDDNLVGSFTAYFDHGLLLIEESGSVAAHEGWDAATEYTHFDNDSLYVAVQSVVDGPVAVTVYRNSAPETEVLGLVEVFSGEFESKFGRVTVHDSDDMVVLVARGVRGMNRVTVFVDEVNWSARVVVAIGPVS